MPLVSASTHPTLLDVANLQDPDGSTASVVEILSQQNEMLQDIVMLPSNEPNSHRHVIRTGLPTGAWRGYNAGVQPSKSSTASVRSTIGNYEMYSEIDRDLANLNGNSAEWRLQEETPFIEQMSQQIQKQFIFGDETNSGEEYGFTGIYKHYNEVDGATVASGDNVIDVGGNEDTGTAPAGNQSILLMCWDPMCSFGIFPRGTQAGLQVEDKGEVTIEDVDGSSGTGGRMEAYRTHYKWQTGLVIRDWRYNVRIANIDYSNLIGHNSTGEALRKRVIDSMFEAINLLPSMKGRVAFYMSRDVRTSLFRGLSEGVKESTLTVEQLGGQMTHMFHGIPIRRVDAMSALESDIT